MPFDEIEDVITLKIVACWRRAPDAVVTAKRSLRDQQTVLGQRVKHRIGFAPPPTGPGDPERWLGKSAQRG
jgi:hypothetical protein